MNIKEIVYLFVLFVDFQVSKEILLKENINAECFHFRQRLSVYIYRDNDKLTHARVYIDKYYNIGMSDSALKKKKVYFRIYVKVIKSKLHE